MTFTDKERTIYNFLAVTVSDGGCAGFEEIEGCLGIAPKIARGVVSSLIKKNLAKIDEDCDDLVWVKHRETGEIGFWSDFLTKEECRSSRIGEEEVAA